MCPDLHLYVLFITDQYKKKNIGQAILVGKCCHCRINCTVFQIFTGCHCIGQNATASPGLCNPDCDMLYVYIAVSFVLFMIQTTTFIPNFIFTMRFVVLFILHWFYLISQIAFTGYFLLYTFTDRNIAFLVPLSRFTC